MSEIEADVREIFRTVKNTEARIIALTRSFYVTGIPGMAVEHEEAPGVVIGRNCNGSIVEVEITR